MKARDVMTKSVVAVRPETAVREVARRLIERNISAVPVVDAEERIVGIVSEGDLMRRPESETERHPSWWLLLLALPEDRAQQYVKSHGLTAGDVMTRNVITAAEETSVEKIAALLEKHRIKRVPIVRNGKIVGIVSRANLLHGLIAGAASGPPSASDDEIKKALGNALTEAGVRTSFLNIVVTGGVVHLLGMAESEEEKRAVHLAARRVPGVKQIVDDTGVFAGSFRVRYWE
jgi:CBS domain-containing protein